MEIDTANDLQSLLRQEIRSCPNCSSQRIKPFERVEWKAVQLRYSICRHCSLVFLNPRMDNEGAAEFYAAFYRKLYNNSSAPTESELELQSGRARHLSQFVQQAINTYRNKSVSFLDIGCSAGVLIDTVRQANENVHVFGVEPGDRYREFCIHNGLKVYESVKQLVASGSERMDIICMSHVLEHLPDPIGELRLLRRAVISEDGFLIIEVRNYFGHNSYEIAHNFCYSVKTFKDTVAAAGFCVQSYTIHSNPLATRRPLYITMVAFPASGEEPIQPYSTWMVRLKRSLSPPRNPRFYQHFVPFLK